MADIVRGNNQSVWILSNEEDRALRYFIANLRMEWRNPNSIPDEIWSDFVEIESKV